jgi:hypothetical protein
VLFSIPNYFKYFCGPTRCDRLSLNNFLFALFPEIIPPLYVITPTAKAGKAMNDCFGVRLVCFEFPLTHAHKSIAINNRLTGKQVSFIQMNR